MTLENSLKNTLQNKIALYESDLKQESGKIRVQDLIDVAADVAFLHNLEQGSSQRSSDDDKSIVLEI